MDSCFTCGNVNCIDLALHGNIIGCVNWMPGEIKNAKPDNPDNKIKTKSLDIVQHNRELGWWLMDNNFSEEIRNKIIEFIGEAYEFGWESGYSECKIVNFMD